VQTAMPTVPATIACVRACVRACNAGGAVNARTSPGAYIAAEDYFFKVK